MSAPFGSCATILALPEFKLALRGRSWRTRVSLLGLEVGASVCKAAVFSEAGRLRGSAYEEYDPQRPQPGWAELDSWQVWDKIKRTISKTAASALHDPIRALCVSSLGEAVVPVTKDRRILGPSLLNFDIRGAEYLDELHEVVA